MYTLRGMPVLRILCVRLPGVIGRDDFSIHNPGVENRRPARGAGLTVIGDFGAAIGANHGRSKKNEEDRKGSSSKITLWDDKPRFAEFAPSKPPRRLDGKTQKSVAYGAAKPRPAPDFRDCLCGNTCCRPCSRKIYVPYNVINTVLLQNQRKRVLAKKAKPMKSLLVLLEDPGIARLWRAFQNRNVLRQQT